MTFTASTGVLKGTPAAGTAGSYALTFTAQNGVTPNAMQAFTLFTQADTQPPTAPSNLTAIPASLSQINLSWTASTDNVGVTGYLVERCQGLSCTSFSQIASLNGTTTTYDDTGLAALASYSYRVRATDAAGDLSAYSNVATTTTKADTQPPTAPSNLTATAVSTSQINLSWTASTDNVGVTNYLVERCQGIGCTTFVQIAMPTTTTYNDTGLTVGITYAYRVRASDAAGNLSPYSNVASTSTPAPTNIFADFYIDMNTSNVGDALTTAALTAGTVNVGASGGWYAYSKSLSLFTIAAHQTAATFPCPVTIAGVTYPANYPSKSIALNNGGSFEAYALQIPSGHRQITVAGFIQFGAPTFGSGNTLFDTWRLFGTDGSYAIMQLDNSSGGAGGYAVNIETDANGTVHSSYIDISPNTMYWMSLNGNWTTGVATLSVYETKTWTLIQTVTVKQHSGVDIDHVDFGNEEAGTASGTFTYFENNVIDITRDQNPIAPNSCAQ